MLKVTSLVFLSSIAVSAEDVWHPTDTGCGAESIGQTLVDWQDAPLSPGGIRIAIQPDTGRGPTTVVAIDPGLDEFLGRPTVEPHVVSAVGERGRTCVEVRPLADCPAAALVLEELRELAIPIGFQSDDPRFTLLLHADTFYLDFRDGQGNMNQWRFYGTDHPLQRVIRDSLSQLDECIAPARTALRESWNRAPQEHGVD